MLNSAFHGNQISSFFERRPTAWPGWFASQPGPDRLTEKKSGFFIFYRVLVMSATVRRPCGGSLRSGVLGPGPQGLATVSIPPLIITPATVI
jgi:hypothetical protein